jgi:hypothetical protein
MTDVLTPPPSPAAGLRAAFAEAGQPLRANRSPAGCVYAVWTPKYAAIIRDANRRPIRGRPAGWHVEIRPVLNRACDGDPVAVHRFDPDEDPRWIARTVLDAISQLEQPQQPEPPAPEPAPTAPPRPPAPEPYVPPGPSLPDIRPDTRPAVPAPWRIYQFTRREVPVVWWAASPRPDRRARARRARRPARAQPSRTRKVRAPGMHRHVVRPGRYAHTSWPPELHVQLGKVEKPGPDVRVWPVQAAGQPVGWVVAEAVPRPTGRIRRTRTLWRAYYIGDPRTDLTGRGRESREGAVAVLVAHWQRVARPIEARR